MEVGGKGERVATARAVAATAAAGLVAAARAVMARVETAMAAAGLVVAAAAVASAGWWRRRGGWQWR